MQTQTSKCEQCGTHGQRCQYEDARGESRCAYAFTWTPSDQDTYEMRLDAVWSACNMMRPGMFLLGEPYDHRGPGHTPRFLAHLHDADGYWVGSRPVTREEFFALPKR